MLRTCDRFTINPSFRWASREFRHSDAPIRRPGLGITYVSATTGGLGTCNSDEHTRSRTPIERGNRGRARLVLAGVG